MQDFWVQTSMQKCVTHNNNLNPLSAAAEDHRTCADEHAHTLRSDLFTTSLNYSTHTHTYILSQMLGSREFLLVWNVSHSGKYNEESKRAGLRYRCGWRPEKYIPPGAIHYFFLTALFFFFLLVGFSGKQTSSS